MIRKMGIDWHLRLRMAERAYSTPQAGAAAGRARHRPVSRAGFRLVTQPPQRLSMDTLAALCDILDCQPGDLIEVKKVSRPSARPPGPAPPPPPRRRCGAPRSADRAV
ncbi:MAG TPA: helix-turn-helix transcriptional regulator [Streptosporangiaceae bacterium]|nr:helix-turn-helix transcriptional regulator [Streptosporangiaceae bacterium]